MGRGPGRRGRKVLTTHTAAKGNGIFYLLTFKKNGHRELELVGVGYSGKTECAGPAS